MDDLDYRGRAPFPSTYKQVIKNMRRINDLINNYISKLINTIFNPNALTDGNSDVWYDEEAEKLKVIGHTIITINQAVSSQPSYYRHDITWELKNSDVIGLAGEKDIGDVVTVMTVRANNGAPCWQVAYSDNHMTSYFRRATDDSTWGAWESVGRKQLVRSDTQPADNLQDISDYWYQTLDESDNHIKPERIFIKTGSNTYVRLYPETSSDAVRIGNTDETLTSRIGTIESTAASNYTTLNNRITSVNSSLTTSINNVATTENTHYNELLSKIGALETRLNNLIANIENGTIGGAVFYGTTPPTNTKALWIDTTPVTGGAKYYNGSSWVHMPVAYS